MKQYAEKFYKSKAWQDTREAYCKSKGWLCEDCKARGIITPGVIVHHVKPITEANIDNPDITLNHDNLRLLCRQCHEKQHRKSAKRFTVDKLGRLHILQE